MSARLASGTLVSALLRKAQIEGGNAAIIARGDATSGAVLLILADRGQVKATRERGMRPDGTAAWVPAGPPTPGDPEALGNYIARRRQSDPDIWIVELDGIDAVAVEDMLNAV